MFTRKTLAIVATIFAVGIATQTASAQTNAGQAASTAAQVATSAMSSEMTSGEIRKIDRDNKKITLKHGAIKNLDMPGMTMVFQVKDASLLDGLAVGNVVQFSAENVSGAIVVTALHTVK
jgi:Cu(I)/Ag(I) efflux system protein CusF